MHYSGHAIRRSLGHFMLGKGVTALAAISLLVALAHQLPRTDFAVYVTLQATVAMVGAISSFGLNQSVLRYLPEMRAEGQNAAMYRAVWRTTATRALVTSACFVMCAASLPWSATHLGLEHQLPWVMAYLAVGTCKLTSQFLSRAMEALLWPRISQYSLAAAASMKLALVAGLLGGGWLSFPAFVMMEGAVELATLLLLLVGFRRQQRRDPDAGGGDPRWMEIHRPRLRHFGRWNYLTTLVTQLASSSPYRLLAPVLFGPDKTALLGFAYGLADLIARLLPARMARLLLRSILVGRQGAREPEPSRTLPPLALSLKVSVAIVATIAAGSLAFGNDGLSALTGGRYQGAGALLAALLTVLSLDLIRLHHDLLASVHERVRSSVGANLGLGAGLVATVLLAPRIGLWAVPVGAAIGQFTALLAYTWQLRDLGSATLINPRMLTQAALIMGSGALVADCLQGLHWLARASVSITVSILLAALVKSVTPAELRRSLGTARGKSSDPRQ